MFAPRDKRKGSTADAMDPPKQEDNQEEKNPTPGERRGSQDAGGEKDQTDLTNRSPSGLRGAFRLDPVWLIDYDELVIADRISESPTAKVFQGEYRGQEVAIKIFNPDMINVDRLQSEFSMISAIRSPHVVVFYGLSLEPKLCVVMEYCAKGTLEDVLTSEDLDEVFDWSKFFQLAKGLASAINLLHRWKPQIIHREIRPQNLLMTDDWQIKFCDFGRARYNDKGDKLKTQTLDSGIENVAYTAPEVYMDGVYSQKTDVYSVGIVLWELAMRILTGSHQKPFHEMVQEGLNSFQILRKTCMQGVRPPILDIMPAPVVNLLNNCWHNDADKRPTAQDLLKDIQSAMNEWKKAPKNSWKVVVKTSEEDEDSDSDSAVTPRGGRSQSDLPVAQPATPTPVKQDEDQKAKEEQIRLEVEKQVSERLKAEEEKLKRALKDKYQAQSSGAAVAEIDAKEVILVTPVGKGQFGEVWKGTLHGKEVAVKKLFIGDDLEETILRDFRREVQVMITLRHPNITLLMGACTQPGHLMIIMEYLSYGSVADLLHGKRKRFLSFEQRMKMAKDASLGMNWLHRMNPPFLHLDLKPQNLLVDSNLNVKVADFGLSQIKGKEGADELGGSPFYMAPEVLLSRGATEKSDVYSFGICLWELYTREEPYKGMFEDEEELTVSVCDDGIRPKLPEDTPKTLKWLITKCWAEEPADRPSFQDVLEQRIFEKINVEEAITDERAAQFWGEFFSTEKKPLWLEFWACLIKFLKPKEVLSERDPRLDYFKIALLEAAEEDSSAGETRVLAQSSTNDPSGLKITRDNFNKFILYYGPMEMNGMVDRLQTIVKSPYFHGDISKKKAQAALLKTKKSGTFLVRYSSRPGDFIISVLNYKHRKAEFEHHIVAVDRNNGQYILLIPPPGTTLNMALDMHRMAVLSAGNGKAITSYPSLDALINACKKTLGISKTSRYLPYKGSELPIAMPIETKTKVGGTQIGGHAPPGKKEKDSKDKNASRKKLGK